jgi:site-specific DNA-methyltransferase (adenine-specific)
MTINEIENKILVGDSGVVLRDIPDNSIDMIVTSPPYLNQRDYSQYPTADDYLTFIYDIIKECNRILKPGSVICWNIGDDRTIDLPSNTSILFEDAGMKYIDTIIWMKPGQLGARGAHIVTHKMYYPYFKHEHIFIYSKGNMSKHIDDDMVDECRKFNTNLWQMNTDSTDIDHPAKFPVELPSRCIKAYTNRGDIVLDPFGGSATTAIACIELGRKYVMIERDQEYVNIGQQRINNKLI